MSAPDPLTTARKLVDQAMGQLEAVKLMLDQVATSQPKKSEPDDFVQCPHKNKRTTMNGEWICIDCGEEGKNESA